jgi:hypothetical protein
LRLSAVLILAVVLACSLFLRAASAGDLAPPTRISIDSLRVLEGDSGTTAAVFTVRLSALPALDSGRVEFVTEDRNSQAGADYFPLSGTLIFNDSTLTYSIPVAVIGDSLVEGNERFTVRLSNPSHGFELADSIGWGTIVNDERSRFHHRLAGLTPYYIGNLAPAFGFADPDRYPDLPLDRNLGNGLFSQLPGMAAVVNWGNHHGSAWCDYDRDGFHDLVISPYIETDPGSKIQLLRNLGGGVFEDVAAELGMDVGGNAETPVWGDFDGDGWPDLFVPFYGHMPPGRSYLWHNNQDGTFTDISQYAGVDLAGHPSELRPEGADAADWDGDGSLDLYVAQKLFLNDGTGRFRDAREETGLPELFDEGAKFVDADNDGDLDLYLRTWTGPQLFRNDEGQFTEITVQAGLPPRPLFWGDSWADVDNDGDMDLLLMNYSDPVELYLNQGDATFVSDPAVRALGIRNFLSAWADVDLDGDLDASVGASERQILFNHLDQKPGAAGSSLRVWVLDADSTLACPGAIARLTDLCGGPNSIQTRVVDGGSGYLAQNEYPLHFGGLGNGRYALEVRYPGSLWMTIIVDGRFHPLLEDFNPAEEDMGVLYVFSDGRIRWREAGTGTALAVAPLGRVPTALGAPFPQPARSSVRFSVRIESGETDLSLHDLAGRRVRSLEQGVTGPGERSFGWDLRDDAGVPVPNGVYFLRMTSAGRSAGERRVVVVR